MENIDYITPDIDLVYSPDDAGYYFTRYSTNESSQIFPRKEDALRAYSANTIMWEG